MASVAPAAAAAAETATAAILARLCFVDLDLSAIEHLAVHGLRCGLRLAVGRHLDERKALALARVAIGDQAHRVYRAARRESLAQRLRGSAVRQIADVKFPAHGYLLR